MRDFRNHGLILLNEQDGRRETRHESTVIITGAARGGTSMLAQILTRLGLFLGDRLDPVVVEDTEILGALQTADFGRLGEIIEDRNSRFPQWGFKVPNLFDFLTAADERRFRNPRYVVVFRDPLAIARRNELSLRQETVKAIRNAGEDIMTLTSYVCQLSAPALLISYEKALQSTEPTIDAITDFCGLTPCDDEKAAASTVISANQWSYIFATQSMYWGHVDNIDGTLLRGWCCYRDSDSVVEVDVYADRMRLGAFRASDYRPDLESAGIHRGRHAFNIDLNSVATDPAVPITVCPAGISLALPNSGRSVGELREIAS